MIDELVWESMDPAYRTMTANMKSAVRSEGSLVLIYEGRDSDVSKNYDGLISLRLIKEVQTYDGTYRDTSGQAVPFSLTGQFTDVGFSSFEGIWVQRGYKANFSF